MFLNNMYSIPINVEHFLGTVSTLVLENVLVKGVIWREYGNSIYIFVKCRERLYAFVQISIYTASTSGGNSAMANTRWSNAQLSIHPHSKSRYIHNKYNNVV